MVCCALNDLAKQLCPLILKLYSIHTLSEFDINS